jgi:hypothetical protein
VELELGHAKEATVCFRHALCLDSGDLLARFFYAMALRSLGEQRQALLQLDVLQAGLAARDAAAVLDDGETRAGELSSAVGFLRGEWR